MPDTRPDTINRDSLSSPCLKRLRHYFITSFIKTHRRVCPLNLRSTEARISSTLRFHSRMHFTSILKFHSELLFWSALPLCQSHDITRRCKFLKKNLPTKLDHYSVDPGSLPEPEFTREDLEQMSSLRVSLPQPHYHPPTRSTSIMSSPQENESSSYASRRTLSQSRARSKHDTLPSTQSASLVIQSTSTLDQPDQQKQPVSGKVCLFHF